MTGGYILNMDSRRRWDVTLLVRQVYHQIFLLIVLNFGPVQLDNDEGGVELKYFLHVFLWDDYGVVFLIHTLPGVNTSSDRTPLISSGP
jgi:hypothetical protein